MKIRTGLRGLAASGVMFLALSTPMREASPTPPAQVEERGTVTASEQVLNEPRVPSIEAVSYAPVIREAHSDGGYWYWQER